MSSGTAISQEMTQVRPEEATAAHAVARDLPGRIVLLSYRITLSLPRQVVARLRIDGAWGPCGSDRAILSP
jgi:hypothetical protein